MVIGGLLLAQAMMASPPPAGAAVPATTFRCTFVTVDEATGATSQFDLHGTTPAMPQGRDPNAMLPVQLGSRDDTPLIGRAAINSVHASDWFRDFQIVRQVDDQRYTIGLLLRREGRSIGNISLYNARWADLEPYRYEAVGLCTADFSPSTGADPQ